MTEARQRGYDTNLATGQFSRALSIAVGLLWLAGCVRASSPAPEPATVTSPPTVAIRDASGQQARTPPDDTTAIMTATGSQVRKDYRGGQLIVQPVLVCGMTHPEPCGPSPASMGDVSRLITVAARAAGAYVAPKTGECQTEEHSRLGRSSIATIEFGVPRIFGDTALVQVSAYESVRDSAGAVMTVERYTYRTTRMSKWAWRVTARYLESTGHFEIP